MPTSRKPKGMPKGRSEEFPVPLLCARTPLFMKYPFLALSMLACIYLSGCATTATVTDSRAKPIVLDEGQSIKGNALNTTTFPAGVYTPDFQTDRGTYYRAPSRIITGGAGMKWVAKGGIFIPFPTDQDQRFGVWWDNQEQSGGLLTFAATSPTIVHRFAQRIVYHTSTR